MWLTSDPARFNPVHIQKEDWWGGGGGRADLQYFGKEEVLFPLRGIELMTARPLAWPLRLLNWCSVNVWNAELNSICHLLVLLGARHIFHVSGLRVKVPYLDFKPSVTAWLSHHLPERVTTFRPWATSGAVRVIRRTPVIGTPSQQALLPQRGFLWYYS